tara:strand:+ start:11706 stop:12668 length:963 start_codon:yes stop_codon:yes gene_type:complete
MSIRARILNYALKKYVKKVQPSVEDRSYLEARKMMNQKGYEDTNSSIVNTSLQKFIFNKKISKIQTNEIYLENIRTLSFDHEELSKDKCILYFHGGGYIAGSPETHQNLLSSISKKSNLKVYAIDYSLAPENPFPAALNDAVESYKSLLRMGYKSKNIFIGGDSAGGNLSIVTILKLQEINEPLPSKVFLLSPWADLTGEGSSIRENSLSDPYLSYDDWLNTAKSMKKTVEEWYAPNQDCRNPMISPIFANFKNFPQTLIQVSNIEILFSDSITISNNLKNNNNGVKLSIYKNLPHVWQIFGFLPESKKAINEISNFLKD